ncbi:hypothetical protein PAPYR_51 [Paratrimastix pyriformis]|uniref:Phospholipid/glycerol acyltransferase domain-containing protein n=1 Tax=Paratrimastix pyriformis TaxID=342808 RepID=A0ABQ8UUR6_9EUKA|nr:hypothetical protein PAPYR_51 [Paratrimastix pyriformis]
MASIRDALRPVLKALKIFFFTIQILFYFMITPIFFLLLAPFVTARRAIRWNFSYLTWCMRARPHFMGPIDQKQVQEFRGVVFTTHKGWFDFCINNYFGLPASLSRLMVAICCPAAFLLATLSGNFLVFRRSSPTPKKGSASPAASPAPNGGHPLGVRICDYLAKRNPRLLVFPEGHRNHERGLLPLRTGIFRICFQFQIPVLLAPAEGSQYIIDESRYLLDRSGRPYVVNFARIVHPKDFPTWEAFHQSCTLTFTAAYQEAVERYDAIRASTKRGLARSCSPTPVPAPVPAPADAPAASVATPPAASSPCPAPFTCSSSKSD